MLEVAQKLEKLASLVAAREALQSEKRDVIAQLVTPEILVQLDEIEAEFNQKEEAAATTIKELEEEIKSDTLGLGQTVKGSGFQAVWTKGRVTWDSKGLSTYSDAHPEILNYRKEGKPFVRIMQIKAKSDGAE